MDAEVTAVVKQFEADAIPADAAVAEIERITGKVIAKDWLENYWRSESIAEFVERVCARPIADWATLSEDRALALIRELIDGPRAGRRDAITDALDRRYRKPQGTSLSIWLQAAGPKDAVAILAELKKDTVIYL